MRGGGRWRWEREGGGGEIGGKEREGGVETEGEVGERGKERWEREGGREGDNERKNGRRE